MEEFDRFYYPQEPFNYLAIKVNGLTQKVITQKRGRTGGEYPLHFAQDQAGRGGPDYLRPGRFRIPRLPGRLLRLA